jgi:hypothetical protein
MRGCATGVKMAVPGAEQERRMFRTVEEIAIARCTSAPASALQSVIVTSSNVTVPPETYSAPPCVIARPPVVLTFLSVMEPLKAYIDPPSAVMSPEMRGGEGRVPHTDTGTVGVAQSVFIHSVLFTVLSSMLQPLSVVSSVPKMIPPP